MSGSVKQLGLAARMPESVDGVTLDEVFRLHARSIERWASRLGGPDLDGDDVVQDVFVLVQQRLPRFREDAAKLTTWLYRITENVVRYHRRKNRWRRWLKGSAEEAAGELEAAGSPVARLEAEEERRRLYAALDRMRERSRTVLILFEMEQLSGEQIAELMDAKVATVWVWLHRARAELLQCLSKQAGKGRAP